MIPTIGHPRKGETLEMVKRSEVPALNIEGGLNKQSPKDF